MIHYLQMPDHRAMAAGFREKDAPDRSDAGDTAPVSQKLLGSLAIGTDR